MPNTNHSHWEGKYSFHFRDEYQGQSMSQEFVEVSQDIVSEIMKMIPEDEVHTLYQQKGFEDGFKTVMERVLPTILKRLKEAGVTTRFSDAEFRSYVESIERALKLYYQVFNEKY